MDKYLNILNLVNENQLPDSFDYGSKEIHIILNLIDEGLISAKVEPVYGSTLVYSARLTMKGEKKLKASKLSTKILGRVINCAADNFPDSQRGVFVLFC